ncbi:hypothetical protein N665_0126s0029 [Sinapis alba]|nr:hypothetical protein N665_0126s0029 [Sinapis alba]
MQRVLFSCGTPFKALYSKKNNACISPHLLSLLSNFETSLRLSITQLVPKDDEKDDFLSVYWMIQAVYSLCETHHSVMTLVTDLDLPVSDLEESLMYKYSDIMARLLQLCNSFVLELSRINDGNMLLKLAFGNNGEFSLSHIDSWRQYMATKNPRIENCGEVLSKLVEYMNDYNILYVKVKEKQTAKVKVLLRALYGVKVKTLYIFSVFAAAFSGSSKHILYLTIPKEMEEEEVPWEEAFMKLQNMINQEIKNTFLSDRFTTGMKDIEAVESSVEKLYAAVEEGSAPDKLMVALLRLTVVDISERFEIASEATRRLREKVMCARDAVFKRVWNKI